LLELTLRSGRVQRPHRSHDTSFSRMTALTSGPWFPLAVTLMATTPAIASDRNIGILLRTSRTQPAETVTIPTTQPKCHGHGRSRRLSLSGIVLAGAVQNPSPAPHCDEATKEFSQEWGFFSAAIASADQVANIMSGSNPDSPPPFPVVLIGASAGGIRALRKLLSELPKDFPAPIVIVQHRSPSRTSELSTILARSSSLPVIDAEVDDVMKAGVVYLARPDLHLGISTAGQFVYSDGRPIRYVLSSVNPLFASAAKVFGGRTIAVVLTGSGADGTDGVQAVKTHGGTVIAQDRATSEHFGMPGSAIATGAVDYVLPLEEIAPALVRLAARSDAPIPS
jgi:two-component system chemotaxis response regulator CheB